MLGLDVVRVEQLQPGQVYNATVVLWNKGGAVVSIGGRIKGFVPNLQFGESFLSNPESKYPVGKRLMIKVPSFLLNSFRKSENVRNEKFGN